MKSWPGSALIFTPSANPVHWVGLRASTATIGIGASAVNPPPRPRRRPSCVSARTKARGRALPFGAGAGGGDHRLRDVDARAAAASGEQPLDRDRFTRRFQRTPARGSGINAGAESALTGAR
jgi:hypothetical protein